MDTKVTYQTFDYRASEEAVREELEKSPPFARVNDFNGTEWRTITEVPFDVPLINALVLADRDAACEDATSGQLKRQINAVAGVAFASGHEAGTQSVIEYIKAIFDGRAEVAMGLVNGDDILEWIVGELGTWEVVEA